MYTKKVQLPTDARLCKQIPFLGYLSLDSIKRWLSCNLPPQRLLVYHLHTRAADKQGQLLLYVFCALGRRKGECWNFIFCFFGEKCFSLSFGVDKMKFQHFWLSHGKSRHWSTWKIFFRRPYTWLHRPDALKQRQCAVCKRVPFQNRPLTSKTNSRTIRSQPAFAGKGADTSELQAHHCMAPEQWTWLLCSVNVPPVNKPSLQELTY